MELLYLWIEDYNNIQNQGFNFSSKWKFDYQNEQLTVEERPNAIDNFFGKDIVNVTALVGANGSGKTSVLEFIYEKIFCHNSHYFTNHNKSSNIFQVPRTSSCFFIVNQVKSNLIKDQLNCLEINLNSFNDRSLQVNLLDNHRKLFYAPFLTKHNNEIYNRGNLTTRALFQRAKEINAISLGGEMNNYELDEDIRFLNFLNLSLKTGKLPFSLSDKKVSLKYNFIAKNNSQFNQTKENLATLNIKKDSEFINTLLKQFKCTQTTQEYKKFLFLKSTIINLLQCLTYCLVRIKGFEPIPNQESLLSKDKQNIYQEFEKLIATDSFDTKISASFPLLKGYLTGILTNEFSPIIDFFFQLIDEEDQSGNNSSVSNTIVVTKEQALEALEKYQSQYFQLVLKFFKENYDLKHEEIILAYGRTFRLIDFSMEGMSSGERLLSQLFARLNSASPYIKSCACESLTILIDEGETSLHPQWQKQYIKLLKETLPLIFKNIPIQIILSSHSPFIVSDLPKENIIFLDTNEQNNTQVVDGLKQKETFGANIHTLFTDAFFMDGGLMGDFAKEQINAVIDFLNNKPSSINSNEKAQKYINLIGEPIIKRQLQKMLDSLRLTKADNNEKDIDKMKQTLDLLKEQVRLLENQINPSSNDSNKS